MSHYERLLLETSAEKEAFLAIPIIRDTLANGVSMELYIAFLGQAYHHVKHTCNLLALAASRCDLEDRKYQNALFEYINEEKGHELWILDDIAALEGDPKLVASSVPGVPCAAMIGYAYYAIEHISPYCLLGMVHVLEGMSVALAQSAAVIISTTLDRTIDGGGFTYLTSHGALDRDHVAFFKQLVNDITAPDDQKAIIATAQVMYELYGGIFSGLDKRSPEGVPHAA